MDGAFRRSGLPQGPGTGGAATPRCGEALLAVRVPLMRKCADQENQGKGQGPMFIIHALTFVRMASPCME